LAQNATSARPRGMSVQPPGADMPATGRFAPEAVIPSICVSAKLPG